MRVLGLTCLAALALSTGGLAGAEDKAVGGRSAATAPASPATLAAAAPTSFAPRDPTLGPATRLVDLNTASRAELMKLPGIGEAEARRILKGRPYKSKTDLVTKKVLDLAAYDRLNRLVMVDHRRAASRSKPAASSSSALEGTKPGS